MFEHLKPIATCAMLMGALGAAPAIAADDAPGIDTVVATVNDTDITLGHMLTLRAGLPDQFAQVPGDVLFKGILDQLVQQTLLVDAHKGDLPKRAKLALDNERRALIATEEMADVTQTAVTGEAIQTYFENNYVNGKDVTEYKAAHILVETEEEAQVLVDDLKDGADFAELAKAKSTGPSGPGGGELGWFSDGMMVQSFQDAVAKMAPGDISGPVQTQFGWHVIKLEETRVKDAPKLEDVRAEIEQALTQKAIEARIAELTEAGKIDRSTGDALDPAVLNQLDLLGE